MVRGPGLLLVFAALVAEAQSVRLAGGPDDAGVQGQLVFTDAQCVTAGTSSGGGLSFERSAE